MSFEQPFRYRILQALRAALRGVTPANGYVCDLSGASKVWIGRTVFGDSDPLPAVTILETPNPEDPRQSAPENSSAASAAWPLFIQGFVAYNKDEPLLPAHVLLADVAKALSEERKTGSLRGYDILSLDGLVTDLMIGQGTARVSDAVSATTYFWLPITVMMVEDRTAPYE